MEEIINRKKRLKPEKENCQRGDSLTTKTLSGKRLEKRCEGDNDLSFRNVVYVTMFNFDVRILVIKTEFLLVLFFDFFDFSLLSALPNLSWGLEVSDFL